MNKDYILQKHQTVRLFIQKFGMSGSTLKIIAVISMLADHFAAGLLGRYIAMLGITQNADNLTPQQWEQWRSQTLIFVKVYENMRMIGRIAFPIFCFLLVEGFIHTGNRMRYAVRLFVFALISEIPFDLFFYGSVCSLGHQNVFFTLFLGMLAMWGIEWARTHLDKIVWKVLAVLTVTALCMLAAQTARTDYAATGVLCIVLLFLLQSKRILQVIAGGLLFLNEKSALIAFVLILLYNGKRGWKVKYFFYCFYPMHLLLMYLIAVGTGIFHYPLF